MTYCRLFSGALAVILVMTGCVGVPDFSQSNRQTFENASRIITEGRIGFSDFNDEERLQCARNLTDASIIIDTLERMSHWRRDSAASSRVNVALSGMSNDLNASIVKALLGNLGTNKNAFDILTKDDICFAPRVYDVAVDYCESCVGEITDQQLLCRMSARFRNWQNHGFDYRRRGVSSYRLQKELYERILPKRLSLLVSNVAEIRDFFASNDSISEADKQMALRRINDQRSLITLIKDNLSGSLVVNAITDQQLLSEIARDNSLNDEMRLAAVNRIDDATLLSEISINEEEYPWWVPGRPKVGERALTKINDRKQLLRIALLAENGAISSKAKRMLGSNKEISKGILALISRKEISESRAACHIEKFAEGSATPDLYRGTSGRLKRLVFNKLSPRDRRMVRAEETAQCDRIVANSKARAKTAFEISGFNIGMSPEDVFTLIGRYYPDIVIIEKEEDGEISFQTSFQEREFCRFGRDGRANIFNFGKGILKKMYHYDVQNEREWVTASSRENGIDMRYTPIEEEATILDVDAGVGFWNELTVNINPRYSKAHLRQDAWQYKDNIRNCKVCYFGKPVVKRIGESGLIEAIAPELLKKWLDTSFENVSFPSGTLQVRADND